MKKKHSLRALLWYFILALPLITYALLCINGAPNFSTVMASFNASTTANNAVANVLYGLFNTSEYQIKGISDGMLQYFCYFVNVELIHICLDIILLLPQICHNFLAKCFHGEDDD